MFSHVRTQDVRREIAWLRRAGEEPTYVVREDDSGQGRAIVRGESRVLLELTYEPGTKVPERCPAYVVVLDEARHLIRLSLERVVPRLWDFPERPSDFVLDCATADVPNTRLRKLEQQLADGPGGLAA